MATISRQIQQSKRVARLGSAERRSDAHVPSRTVANDPDSLASWLLPPEPATGMEAFVQATSKGAGIAFLLLAVAAVAWVLIG